MTSAEAYKEAYNAHYKEKDLEKAFSLYCRIQKNTPDASEARYAGQQLANIDVTQLDENKIKPDIIDSYHRLLSIKTEKELKEKKETEKKQYLANKELIRQQKIHEEEAKTIALFSDYRTTYSIAQRISFNKERKVFAIHTPNGYSRLHEYSELIDYELYEDGRSVISGNVGAAAMGAMLFGVTGAVIGASASKTKDEFVSDLHIRLIFDDIENVMEKIPIVTTPVKKQSNEYREHLHTCESILSALRYVLHHNKKGNKKAITVFSVADEIKKFRTLLNEGIITESEYIEQKEKLLSIDYSNIYFNE